MKSRRDILKMGIASTLIATLPKLGLDNIYLLKANKVVNSYFESEAGERTPVKYSVVLLESGSFYLVPIQPKNASIDDIKKFDDDCLTYNGERNKYITLIITPEGHGVFGSAIKVHSSKLLV